MKSFKSYLWLTILLFYSCGPAGKNGKAPSEALRPNIVLIMADDMGYGDLGCYGNSEISTPHIDSLASGGLLLTDYHSNGVVCSPTRASLLTGLYPQETGIEGVVTAKSHRHTGMPPKMYTLAELLKEAGYRTALFGKWHLGYSPEFNPVMQGFDEFRGFVSGNIDYKSHIDQEGFEDWWKQDTLQPEEGYLTDLITRHGVRFIKEVKDSPFFLYLPHGAPHYPYQGPGDPAIRAPDPAHASKQRGDTDNAYREMIESLDRGVGRVMSQLKESGILENTLIIFCSDNGAAPRTGSNGPFRGHKGQVYEGGHRVPAVFYWKGTIAPGVSDDLVLSMDIMPTIAGLLQSGTEDRRWSGQSILPLLKGERQGSQEKGRTVFWRFKDQKAARQGKWKLVVTGEQGALFDLENDPGESRDLKETFPDIFKTLMKAIEIWESGLKEPIRA